MKCLKFGTNQLSILSFSQVVTQFSNFLYFGEEGEDEKRLVGLRRASAAGKKYELN